VGEILRILPDGSAAPIKETMKVGIRRTFGFKGCPLHPPVPEYFRPPASLEDFAEFDPDEDVISSPRSERACQLHGVSPEDLIYVPLEDYKQGVEPRIAELWYDFFEALRQDTLRDCRALRSRLVAEEEGRSPALSSSSTARHEGSRIAGTGGNWEGALEHCDYRNVAEFFHERNEMCNIDRIYKGATKPFRSVSLGSRYFSNNQGFRDQDPILAGDDSNDAADKLDDLLQYYKRLPNCKKFVEEQRLVTEANGVVQYDANTKRLHKDQKEFRRLTGHRMDTEEVQIAIVDGEIQENKEIRADMDRRSKESKKTTTKLEQIRSVAINKRSAYFQERRDAVHETKLDYQYFRCDELHRHTMHDQAVAERKHQHDSLRKIGFAREWTKRRVRWQLNHNSISANRDSWNQAILGKQQAAADRVETQHLIRQKWIEYRREIKLLKRTYADLAAQREKAKQDVRKEAVAVEFARMAQEEAQPSPSPLRRTRELSTNSLASSAASMQTAGSAVEMLSAAPFSPLLKQPRVVKRIASFNFPRMGAGMMSSTSTTSTRSGNWSLSGASTLRQSTSMQSLGGGSMSVDRREMQR